MSTSVTHRHEAEVTVDEVAVDAGGVDTISVDTATIKAITEIEAQAIDADGSGAQISWNVADDGLWVANYGGYYGGVVDRQGEHYFVADTFGQYVGDFRSLDVAQAKLAERLHVLLPAVLRTAP